MSAHILVLGSEPVLTAAVLSSPDDNQDAPMNIGDPPRLDPVSVAWNTVASFDDYAAAQRAVDRLSDDGFPVDNLDIVGSDLRTVERVVGRMTTRTAAAAGAASGAWFGLFMGLLIGLFTDGPAWLGLLVAGLLLGALWGAIAGYAGHAATRGQRDFASVQSLVAMRYDIVARGGTADQARQLLAVAGLLPAAQPAG